MAIYKSKYREFRATVKRGWVEIINGVRKNVPEVCAEFINSVLNTAEHPMVLNGTIKEKEMIEILDKHASPQGDFWKVEDNLEAKKFENKKKPAMSIEDYREGK